MTREQWSGVIFALLVVIPAAFLPKLGEPELLLKLRYSMWVLIPVLGGAVSGWVARRRIHLALFGALAGYSGFWCAASWGAGSKATSIYETMVATGVGVIPVLALYGLYKRIRKSGRMKCGACECSLELQDQGMSFGQIVKNFWKQILFFGGAFVILSIITAVDLNALEAGTSERIRAWAPVVSFYERFGYWPSILFVPVLGLVCGTIFCWKLMKHGRLQP